MQMKKIWYSEKFSDRIAEVIRHSRKKKSEFAKIIGVSPSNISDWLGERYQPNGVVLIRIAETFSINLNWLMTGEGSMLASGVEKAGDGQSDDKKQKPAVELPDEGVVNVKSRSPKPVSWREFHTALEGFLSRAEKKDVDLIIRRCQLWLALKEREENEGA